MLKKEKKSSPLLQGPEPKTADWEIAEVNKTDKRLKYKNYYLTMLVY